MLKLRFIGLTNKADEHICITVLKHSLEIEHNIAKYVVECCKKQQVTTIEIQKEKDRNQIISNLNFVGFRAAIV